MSNERKMRTALESSIGRSTLRHSEIKMDEIKIAKTETTFLVKNRE